MGHENYEHHEINGTQVNKDIMGMWVPPPHHKIEQKYTYKKLEPKMLFTMLKQIEELKRQTKRQQPLEVISDIYDVLTFKMSQEKDYTTNMTLVYWL